MTGRQNGVPIRDAIANVIPLTPVDSQNLMRTIITKAYETPRYGSASFKQDAITDFGNEVFLMCSSAMQG